MFPFKPNNIAKSFCNRAAAQNLSSCSAPLWNLVS